MNSKHIYIALLSMVIIIPFLFSCKKDQAQPTNSSYVPVYDTLFPLDYFPAYPGSYWKYVDSNNDTTVSQTDAEYQLDHYEVTLASYKSDTFYVPIYDGIPIWEYSAHSGYISHSGSSPVPQFLSETLGSDWLVFYQGVSIRKKVTAVDTSITIDGTIYSPTIVVDQYYSTGGPPNTPFIEKLYYTKDIGIIRLDTYNYLDSTITVKELCDYFIND